MSQTPTRFLESPRVQRWVPLVLAVACGASAVGAAVGGTWPWAVVFALLALNWLWWYRRSSAVPAPVPGHVDEAWARRVIAEAGSPEGVAAVVALRRAEPALSLVTAKELADRVTG
ncbi:hypothetical protein [Modestobacter roseus]|uniref:hypothetical protein n=1 Tax=Modestobacter roseus TaxID=1181884 RepID=UPI001294F761|nr:hypothetical protein [Modestobacter roseus]MQA32247.1 hypothetical protein [Modestobacter roseus]